MQAPKFKKDARNLKIFREEQLQVLFPFAELWNNTDIVVTTAHAV